MTVLPEGTIGKARLEIIIDDTIFVPWEDAFMVEGLKKVSVEILPKSKVSVNLKDDE
jgi:aromatic ring hydroxylase